MCVDIREQNKAKKHFVRQKAQFLHFINVDTNFWRILK
jgi:hypothetical protein